MLVTAFGLDKMSLQLVSLGLTTWQRWPDDNGTLGSKTPHSPTRSASEVQAALGSASPSWAGRTPISKGSGSPPSPTTWADLEVEFDSAAQWGHLGSVMLRINGGQPGARKPGCVTHARQSAEEPVGTCQGLVFPG